MTNGKRLILVVGKEGSAVIIEFADLASMQCLRQEAESKGLTCKQIGIEDYLPTYRGRRYFDMQNPITKKLFNLDYLIQAWESDKNHHDGEGGVDEWFIH
ncbi:MAG: hypothetical protein G3M78_08035 [Candidatus Nitrohelix vancouverensis]|uniref:Uncharacterized protein n=1 Tax=Candidatus Nitrohelix vancouverensis TaxID=2705534 RepID=A0A7T0C2H3_9BACT|nr:MAG: hypothetical protein G3M78_08035 [Candidatus Nitrohelix vancouverensis]